MDDELIIYLALAVCILGLIYYIFKNQLKTIAMNIVFGVMAIYVINILYPGIKVGINPITIAVVGSMGVPGIAMLYISRIIL